MDGDKVGGIVPRESREKRIGYSYKAKGLPCFSTLYDLGDPSVFQVLEGCTIAGCVV